MADSSTQLFRGADFDFEGAVPGFFERDTGLPPYEEDAQLEAKATASLNLFRGNPEQRLNAMRQSLKTGLPVSWHEAEDNAMPEQPLSAKGLTPRLQKFLQDHPEYVPIVQNQLPEVDDLSFALQFNELKQWEKDRFFAIQGQLPLELPGRRTVALQLCRDRKGNGLGGKPRIAQGLESLSEREAEAVQQAYATISQAADMGGAFRDMAPQLSGLSESAQKALVGNLLEYSQKRLAFMMALKQHYGSKILDSDFESLAQIRDELSTQYGVDFTDIDVHSIGTRGGVETTDWMEAVNFFGWWDAAQAGRILLGRSPEELAKIDRNSPIEDQLALMSHLTNMDQDMRGYTWGAKALQGTLMSLPFLVEFAVSGGLANVTKAGAKVSLKAAVKSTLREAGLKGLGLLKAPFTKAGWKAAGYVALGEAKRSWLYIPKNLAKAYNETASGPLYVADPNTGVKAVVPEQTAGALFSAYIRYSLSDYLGRVSEWGSEFMPNVGFSNLIPKSVRNSVVGQLLKSPRGIAFLNKFKDNVPLYGEITEFFEEEWNRTLEFVPTMLGKLTGIEALDLGADTPLLPMEEAGITAVSCFALSALSRGFTLPFKARRMKAATDFKQDHQRVVDAAGGFAQNTQDTEVVQDFMGKLRGGDALLQLDTEDAEEFMRENPEMAEGLGITQETIQDADRRGDTIRISQNRLAAEQAKSPEAREAGDKLLDAVTSVDPQFKSIDEIVDKMTQEIITDGKRRAVYKKKILDTLAVAKASGVSDRAVRAVAELMSFCYAHLAEGLDTNEDVVGTALDKLASEVLKDPEAFVTRPLPDYLQAVVEKVVPEAPLPEASATEAEGTKKAKSKKAQSEAAQQAEERFKARFGQHLPMVNKKVGKFINDYGDRVALDSAEMESIAQEAIARALHDYAPRKGASETTFVSRYVDRALRDYVKSETRRQQKAQTVSLDENVGAEEDSATRGELLGDATASSADSEIREREAEAALSDWQAKLTPEQKQILEMLQKGKSADDIALALDMEVDAVDQAIADLREQATAAVYAQEDEAGKKKIIRGAFFPGRKFSENFHALLSFFQGKANASTVWHESAHHLYALMEALCEMKDAEGDYIAKDSLREEFAAINRWLDRQKYEYAPGTQEYEDKRREKFARAWEHYVRNCEPPTFETASAFNTLKGFLMKIYRYAKALPENFGFVFDQEIEDVFRGMFTAEAINQRENPVREVLEDLDAKIREKGFEGLLGLGQKEAEAFKHLIQQADAQMRAKIERRRKKLLPGLRRQWREAAAGAIKRMRELQAFREASKTKEADGRLDYATIEALCGKEAAEALKARGLTKINGADVSHLVEKYKYSSVQDLVSELLATPTPEEVVKSYLSRMEEQFNNDLGMDEDALSARGTMELLDSLIPLLATKGGIEGYRSRKAEQVAAAKAEINKMTVSQILSVKTAVRNLKSFSANLLDALRTSNYVEAFNNAEKIRKNLAVLREQADAKAEIERQSRRLKRVSAMKKGKIYAGYHDALRELAYFFRFSDRKPDGTGARQATIQAERDEAKDLSEAPRAWSKDLYTTDRNSFKKLTYEQFQELSDFADHLYGVGRNLVVTEEGTRAQQAQERLDACLNVFATQKHKYHARNTTSLAYGASLVRAGLSVGYNLTTLLSAADGYSNFGKNAVNGPNMSFIREPLMYAAADALGLEARAVAPVKKAIDALYEMRKTIKLPINVKFIGDGLTYGYDKWTAERVIAACLNMGNDGNRQRLRDGYGWTEEDLNEIASCLPASAWLQVQEIWKTIGNGELQRRVAETFQQEHFYELRLVPAKAFDVTTSDGERMSLEGGYYPIHYIHLGKLGDIPQGYCSNQLYTPVSSTEKRQDEVKGSQIELSLRIPIQHIHEAAQYAAMRMPLRAVLKVALNEKYATAFGETQSFEDYKALKALLKNIANPNPQTEDLGRGWESWARSTLVATALLANAKTIFQQFASVTVGIDELGSYYLEGLMAYGKSPGALSKEVKQKSFLMNQRAASFDLDLKKTVDKFSETGFQKAQRGFAFLGYYGMRFTDSIVATIAWQSKYLQAQDQLARQGLRGEELEKKAVAQADDFVARTQGATRTIDLMPAQLYQLGRLLNTFITPSGAAYNSLVQRLGAMRAGRLTASEAFGALFANLIMPALASGVVAALAAGAWFGDDEDDLDRSTKAFLREALSNPFSGMPYARDIANYVAAALADRVVGGKKSYRPELWEMGALERASAIIINAAKGLEAGIDGNGARALWLLADAIGDATHIPAIRIYKRAEKLYQNYGGVLPRFWEEIRKEIDNKKGTKK